MGSAAFNFFVISGVSIYAVHEDNDDRDEDELEEDETPLGVKKIYDMGVFTITCTCSMLAYIWTFYCLIDYEVTQLEAWLTLGFMFVLLIAAYTADKCKQAKMKKIQEQKMGPEPSDKSMKEPKSSTRYSPLEFYQTLLPMQMGQAIKEEEYEKAKEMKEFLKGEFGTDKIQHINEDELKKRIQGESIIDRLKYRKQVGLVNIGKKSIVQKGQKVVIEEQDADHLAKDLRHDEWGFQNLKYSVSEASGSLKIKINNKKKQKAEIGIKTVEIAEGGAKPGKDYDHVEKVIQFTGNPH